MTRPRLLSAADTAERRSRLIAGAMVAAAALMAFIFMRPDKIFLANTPSGGDMGAHVVIPAYLRDVLLPSGRVLGWSNDWYAGFPMLYFYFPLPAFTVVLLDLLLPYGVAFKLVTVAGLVALPAASYYFARQMGFARPVALVGGLAGSSFMFMETFSIFGGNTLSTLAGEYSFSWSFALCLVYLGMVMRNIREGRGFTVGPAVVLALAALSHVITTAVAVVASLPLLLRRKGAPAVVGSWALGLAVAAFWAVPFLTRALFPNLMTDMGWNPRRDWADIFPRDMWPVLVLGAAGLAWAVARRAFVGPVAALLVLGTGGYWLIAEIGYTALYNGRLLPFYYYGVYLFAGLFVGLAAMELVRRLRAAEGRAWGVAVAGAALFLVIAGVGVHKTPAWAQWNYTGYEGKAAYPEYRALLEVVDHLPPGRIMWEYNSDQNKYGTPMALMLLPYWSEGHSSMEGLLFESSLTTPFHFLMQSETSYRPSSPVSGLRYRGLDMERAVPHLALYNISYYISYTEEGAMAAADYGLEQLAETPPFEVFALPESSLVDVATYQPAVWAGEESFYEAALDWFDDITRLDRWVVADGPAEWPRIDAIRPADVRRRTMATGEVSEVVLEPHRISFRTTAVGVPHLVKVSYFPNWKATGAEGPFRAAPSLMVVVPTSEEVVLDFRNTLPEYAGMALSVGGVGGVAVLLLLARRRRRQGAEQP
ncbi:MAG: hypothetical protein JW785_10870 [Acidimicrobiia bacterium]|nr:hypothetical protein [Acidimicrobiia bacterium]